MKLADGEQIGKYVTKQHLGDGSFGSVYEMTDGLLQRSCAVKFVPNKNPAEFKEHYEAQILHRCKHDRIVGVNSVDVFKDKGGQLFAAIDMEYCPDGSVQDLLEHQFVSIRRSLKILIDVCFALEHAHRQTILHRDVKPANIMTSGDRYKLSDFGVAKSDLAGSGAGTPVYLAPEVVLHNTTNIATEVFSAGITLFQLCNNYPDLSERVNDWEVVKAGRVIDKVGYRDYVPRRIRTICNKACSPDPARRYANIEEMRQAMERLRVTQDWQMHTELNWTSLIKNKKHEMLAVGNGPVMCIYLVNGRKKSANCTSAANPEAARQHFANWVYENTFA